MSWNRILSGTLALAYVLVAYAYDGPRLASIALIGAVFPLACIWFADAMGGFVGASSAVGLARRTPGSIVRTAGWVLLLLPTLIGIAYWIFESRKRGA